MSILKCKMCGGDLEVAEEIKIIECEYCGTKQTVPNVDNEKKINLFNRANRLRMASEFDKAAGIYENIIAEFPEEAEAYWGLCLCNYGIEYVDDPSTAKKIPTCHRASFESLQKDENFELALEYADVVVQKVYRDEAREIDRIMSEILAVSKNEKPYDVFICYKETDEKGERTIDSVLAYDIYEALTAKGLNVFFARVTLEDKLGIQYEPYIFAALNSAKVMLSIGTKYEYFHAVWVKNEWSRFLKLMVKDKSKVLIPCFKDIDAYDMPDEFKGLQAQDLGKLGAVQDIVRGVEKIIGITVSIPSAISSNSDASALTMRGYIYLEDGDFDKADSYFDRALDSNPVDPKAYVGKVLCTLRLTALSEIEDMIVDLSSFKDFERALRFADGAEKASLESMKERADKKCAYKRLSYALGRVAKKKANDEARIQKEKEDDERKRKEEEKATEFREQIKLELKEPMKKANFVKNFLASGRNFSACLKSDGNVVFWGDKYSENCESMKKVLNSERWSYIISICAGWEHLVGLNADGTVVAIGENNRGQCDVSKWTSIVAICAGNNHTVGLKSDGTVVAVGENANGQCEVSRWTDIIAISAGSSHTLGLKSDGRVVAVGDNTNGQCNVSNWSNISCISAGYHYTIGLREEGKMVITGGKLISYSMPLMPCTEADYKDMLWIVSRTTQVILM